MTEELSQIEIAFLLELENLPDETAELLIPPLGKDGVTIPCPERKIGDMMVKIFPRLILITIGEHTRAEIYNVKDAIKFIRDVVTDEIVFHFHDDEVDYYRFEEFLSLSDADYHFFVWSGPFRYAFLERQNKR